MRRKHTKDNCKLSASRFNTRGEFSKFDQGMYKTSMKNGWLDDFFPGSGIAKPQYWTLMSAVREARKFKTSGDLMRSNRSAYNYIKSLGLVSRVFGNRNKDFWTKGVIRSHALMCENRSEFYKKYRSAYAAMMRIGCKEYAMKGLQRGKSESDLFYMWEVISPVVSDVWKVGVTSSKIKSMQRAKDSSRSMGVSVGMYFEIKLGVDAAADTEKFILSSSDRFLGLSGDGSTELVIKNKSDVYKIFNELGKFKLVN